MVFSKILKSKILAKISPSASEAKAEKAFAARLAKILSGIGAEKISFVGSAARDTGLRGDNDIDLFVQFPQALDEEHIVGKTFEFTKENIKADWIVRYAEHPYLQAKIGAFKVEVIPCFTARPHEGIKSAVDRSPLHMDYLQKRLTAQQRGDVRLLKQLLKNNGLYGAEVAVKGFSGLVCEYLILNFRTFEGLVASAAKWRPPVRIDIEGSSQKRFEEPLAIIDAIDRNRNAAAVVSETNANRFIALCQALSAKPSEKFFFWQPKRKSASELNALWKKRGTCILLVEFNAPDLVEDILVPQLRKTEEHALKQLRLEGYSAFGSTSFVNWGKAFLLFEFSSAAKPLVEQNVGPPAWNAKAVSGFLKNKKPLRGPFVDGEKVVVELAGTKGNAIEFLKNGLARGKWGVGSHLAGPLRKARFLEGDSIFKPDCLSGLQDYFCRKEPWW